MCNLLCKNEYEEGDMMTKWKKDNNKNISIHSKVYSFALKFYDEQLPWGLQETINAIKALDKGVYQVLLICHDRDEVADGIWRIAMEKRHYHLIFRCVDTKQRIRISQVLDMCHIFYRPGIDDLLVENKAIETVGSFQAYAMYLTHETDDAIRDNKELYDVNEITSNLSIDEIKAVRDGYSKLADAPTKIGMSKLAQLDAEAYKLGYELKDFDKWYNAQSFAIRSNSKMKIIRESYERGVEALLNENPRVTRLCIFIKGKANSGKTFASLKALEGKNVLSVGGGGTGKFDKLKPSTDAIVIDDDVCPNLLNMADNFLCRVYRRGNNNPVWAGKYLIITSNLSFTEWLRACGIKVPDSLKTVKYRMTNCEHYKALLSRFFVCCIKEDDKGANQLALVSPSTRGSWEEQAERLNNFLEFQEKFNCTIGQYTAQSIDYSQYIATKCCADDVL